MRWLSHKKTFKSERGSGFERERIFKISDDKEASLKKTFLMIFFTKAFFSVWRSSLPSVVGFNWNFEKLICLDLLEWVCVCVCERERERDQHEDHSIFSSSSTRERVVCISRILRWDGNMLSAAPLMVEVSLELKQLVNAHFTQNAVNATRRRCCDSCRQKRALLVYLFICFFVCAGVDSPVEVNFYHEAFCWCHSAQSLLGQRY